jgi:hypothetical protein
MFKCARNSGNKSLFTLPCRQVVYKPEYASRVLNILLKVFRVYSIKFVQLEFLSLNRIEANNELLLVLLCCTDFVAVWLFRIFTNLSICLLTQYIKILISHLI